MSIRRQGATITYSADAFNKMCWSVFWALCTTFIGGTIGGIGLAIMFRTVFATFLEIALVFVVLSAVLLSGIWLGLGICVFGHMLPHGSVRFPWGRTRGTGEEQSK